MVSRQARCSSTAPSKGSVAVVELRRVLLTTLLARVISVIEILESQWTDRRNLGDVLAGLRPVEVWCIAWQDDDAAWRIGLDLVPVEPIAEANVEDAGHDRVDAVLWVSMRH